MQRMLNALKAWRADRFLNAFNLVFMGVAVLYRIALAIGVMTAEAAPFGTERSFKTFILLLTTLANDVIILIMMNAIFLVGYCIAGAGVKRGTTSRRKNLYILAGYMLLVFWHTIVSGSHFNLMFNMNSGVTWGLFSEFFNILRFRDLFALMTFRDFLTIPLPLTVFVILARRHNLQLRKRQIAGVTVGVFLFMLVGPLLSSKKIADELRMSPHAYLLRDLMRVLFSRSEVVKQSAPTGKVFLGDPLFAKSRPDEDTIATEPRSNANIIVIVLESNAAEYIFDTKKYADGKMPMPYLHSLTDKSLYMTHHFASNNSSPRSIFSIFSGLYESPQISFFSMEKNLKVPHLVDFLGKKYASFLVTPADINWYFPKYWFKNRGFAQIFDYNALKTIPEYKAGPTAVRDEFASVDYFTNLVAETKQPFLGVYYTFIGHWPYADLTPEHKILPATSSRNNYINNLYAQDQIIKQIITSAEKSGKFDDTIFVVVGDHGEAFYQHPGNRVHSGESYNENIAAPLLIYSPRYVKVDRIDYPTVHADIVPTLLETLGIPYKKKQFQGESLLEKPLRRYVFSYGNENTLTAVAGDLKKMQILRKDEGGCRYFDLKRDSVELNNMACPTASDHYRAIETFFRVQPGILKGYNDLCNRSGC
jgi:hypothetical protein